MKCPFEDYRDCEICNEQAVFKSKRCVEESRRLIEIYKALSSPTYILHSGAEDPILEAFKLSKEMSNLAIEDAPFKVCEMVHAHVHVGTCTNTFTKTIMAIGVLTAT